MSTRCIAYVARVKPGMEAELREIQQHMPHGAMKRLGICRVDAFVGSGYYLLVFDHEDSDFQTFFQRFSLDPGMRGFWQKLEPYVDGLPSPAFAPGDEFHHTAPGRTGVNVTSASLPLVAHAYRWVTDAL